MAKREPTPQYRAVVELRRSNVARPVPSGKRYRRRAKHGKSFPETS